MRSFGQQTHKVKYIRILFDEGGENYPGQDISWVIVVVVVRLASGSDVFFFLSFFFLIFASLRWLPTKAMLFALPSDCF